MLEKLFGNKNAERVLLHIYHYGEIHASGIANDYQIALDPILKQLQRFEDLGVIVSKQVGRSRVYLFNPKSVWTKPLLSILKIAYESLSQNTKNKIFSSMRKPRRKGKST